MADGLWGRDHELSELAAVATDARGRDLAGAERSPRGRVVVVSGPPGIGKSALVDTWSGTVAGAQVIRGRAWEFADAPPYFPIAPMLRALGVDPERAASPFALWEAVLDALAKLTTPTVWIVEDVHAADLQTLDLLVFLSQPVRSLPLVIVVTRRDVDARIDTRAGQRLERLARSGLVLRLAPLDATAVSALAERWAARPLGKEELRALTERTEGNPLFVVEMMRGADARRLKSGAVPGAIRDVVIERVEALPPAARRALEAGAILGRDFAAGHAARMLELLPARLIDDLAPAIAAGLVVERSPGLFAFGHILERDAVAEALGAERRAALHARAAAALAKAGDAPEVIALRARHALDGVQPGDEEATLRLVSGVIDALEQQRAYDRAFALAERLEEARRTTLVAFPSTPEEVLRVATLAQRAGRDGAWRAMCQAVLERTRRREGAATFARAALLLGAQIRPGVADHALAALLDEALALLDGREPALACLLGARRAAALQPAPEPLQIVDVAREVITRARTLNDDGLLAEVLVTAGSAMVDYAPLAERIELWQELLERALRTGDVPKVLRARQRLANDLLQRGSFGEFEGQVDEILRLSAEYGHARYRWQPLLFASMRARMHGDFDESDRHLVEIEQLAVLADDPALGLCLRAHRWQRTRDGASVDELRAVAANIAETTAMLPMGNVIAAILRAQIFTWGRERSAVAAEIERLQPHVEALLSDAGFRTLLAEAAAFAGDEALRRQCREVLLPLETEEAPAGHVSVSYEGSIARLLGLLDVALGNVERGRARLEIALERARRHRLRPWVERVEGELAAATAGSVPARVAAPAAPLREKLQLEREGEMWRIRCGSREVVVRDVRGMRLLARLVAKEGEDLHVLVLASDEGGALSETDAGERLDAKALASYRARLGDLGEELADAERAADLGRIRGLKREKEYLEAEIAAAGGLGGRTRRVGSATERARVNVQRRLRDAIGRITEVDEVIGKSLERAVRTGTYCCYRP